MKNEIDEIKKEQEKIKWEDWIYETIYIYIDIDIDIDIYACIYIYIYIHICIVFIKAITIH